MKYIVPRELKTETKLWKWLHLKDLLFIIAFVAVMNMLSVFIAPQLTMPYTIFNIIIALLLTSRSMTNPDKKLYHSIYFLLLKDKGIYKPIKQSHKEELR